MWNTEITDVAFLPRIIVSRGTWSKYWRSRGSKLLSLAYTNPFKYARRTIPILGSAQDIFIKN